MDWQNLKLGELTDYRNGLWAGKSGALTSAKVVRLTEIKNDGSYDLSTAKELQVEERKLATRKLVPNSILLERSGGGENKPVGRVILFGDDVLKGTYSFSNFTTLLLPKVDLVEPRYLFYFLYFFHLSGKTKELQKAVTGIRNLDFARYLEQEVPLPFKDDKPDLAEQKRIADKLDSVFAGVRHGLEIVERENEQVAALKESLLAKAFINPGQMKISEIAEVNPKKDLGTLKPSTEVSFVPMESVDETTGTIIQKQTRRLEAVSKGYTFFKDGDVIFAKITPCMENGKCAIADKLSNGIGFGSTEFYVVRANKNVLPAYVWHFLRQTQVRKEAARHFTGAAGQKRVPKSFIENLELPIPLKNGEPDLEGQVHIVDELIKTLALSKKMTELLQQQEYAFFSLRLSALDAAFKPQVATAPIVSPIQPVVEVRMFDIQQAVAQILKRFQRGEMVVAKVLYIGQAVFGVPTNIQFTAQNFGPYDSAVKRAVMAGLSPRNNFFTKRGYGTNQVLTLGTNASKILQYSNSGLARKTNDYLDEMMPYFYQYDSASIERLATICKIIEDEKTADDQIVRAKLQEWKPNKFSYDEVSRTLAFIKKHEWDKRLIK